MKIAFLFKKDSHFKAVKSTALRVCVQYNCEPIFIGIDSEFSPSNEAYSVVHIDKQDLTSLYEYDYVIACLGGYLLNQVVSTLRDTDTKVISIFPGIVSHYQLDAFISRLNADQVWLNSKADFKIYSLICKLLNQPNNSLLYGMSWLKTNSKPKCNLKTKRQLAIFFEQTEILKTQLSKDLFFQKLVQIILNNSDIDFIYKIRDNTENSYYINLRDSLDKFDNVKVVSHLECNDVEVSSYYLSISSSAIVEGIVDSKTTMLIDERLLDADSKEFYRGSNLFMKRSLLVESESLNINWYKNRVTLPIMEVKLEDFSKRKFIFRPVSSSFVLIRTYILLLSLFSPKFFKVFVKNNAINSIKKSLEYLNS